jgi:hypothetical protein
MGLRKLMKSPKSSMGLRKLMKSPAKKGARGGLYCSKKSLMACRDARPGCTWVVSKGCRNRDGRRKKSKSPKKSMKKKSKSPKKSMKKKRSARK